MIGRSGPARSRRAARLGVPAALAALAVLAGCVSIPTAGPVSRHEIAEGQTEGEISFIPRGPSEGADQEEILDGFLAAGSGPQDSYAIARQFLSTDFASAWNPTAAVLVAGPSRTTTRTGEFDLGVQLSVAARVDASGRYSAEPTAATDSLGFRFVEEDGEWRIAAAPNATVISPNTFQEAFDGYPLYFLDPSGDYLVPDLRWFPRVATVADRIVGTLLDGPADWLTGAVASAFPTGTELGRDGVTTEAGVAVVDLGAEVLAEPGPARARMLAQLAASLAALDTVRGVELRVQGFPVDVPSGIEPADAPTVDGNALVIRDQDVGFLSSATVRPIAGLAESVLGLEPRALALQRPGSAAQPVAAVLGEAGVFRAVAGSPAVVVDQRAALVAPTIDPVGWIWSVPRTDPSSILATDPSGAQRSLAIAPQPPAGSSVVSIALSRDGARLLVGMNTPAGPQLVVAAVQRDAEIAPVALGSALALPSTASGVLVDAAWVDATTVAVLTDDGARATVRSVQIGGGVTALGAAPVGSTTLVGGNGGPEGLRVRGPDGEVFRPSGTGGWQGDGVLVQVLGDQQ